MPAFCPRCGDLLKGVPVCAKCQLDAVTTPSASFHAESSPAVELSPILPPVVQATLNSPLCIRKLKKCGVCSNPIVGASHSTRKLGGDQVTCHDICLTCKHCRKSINDADPLAVLYHSAYHETCAVGLRVCHGCHEPIVGKAIDDDSRWFHRVCHDTHVKVMASGPPSTVASCGERVLALSSVQAPKAHSDTSALSITYAANTESSTQITNHDALALEGNGKVECSDQGIEVTGTLDTTTDVAEPIRPHEEDSTSDFAIDFTTESELPVNDTSVKVWPLQIKPNVEPPPVVKLDEPRQTCSDSIQSVQCHSCGLDVLDDSAMQVPSGDLYHEQCFVCSACALPISDELKGFTQVDLKMYHPPCYYAQAGRVCHGCHDALVDGTAIMHAISKRYHPRCFRCTDCSTVLTNEYLVVNDDVVCRECYFHLILSQSTREEAATAVHSVVASVSLISPRLSISNV
ncbi:hypothetical protein, variant 1 [Aphanomyces astaci]|uniref:LIM zinc-binding domain-containing protein n=1 Tax=Aphanomyces astaci TaxID=112090 RepID=W4FP18_APHAT|nr:hypothetical protein, variant 1 [Aphanomyces astaci]ETV69242.1 hypothetical protein, variant 1 [Aphanomyces astaci]|eukprot:XP_009841099.1 hypothetical protein, variant 1 [Aphanomyces astaci]